MDAPQQQQQPIEAHPQEHYTGAPPVQAAPVQAQQSAAAPPMQKSEMQGDVDHWMGRLNHAAANSAEFTNQPGSAPWSSEFFDCFNPIDNCLLTCCCPCVAFGRTHHRLHKDKNLAGFSVVNASCVGWYLTACFGFHCIGNLFQRNEIRARSNPQLSGDFATDCLKAWCCSCCDMIQQDKEAQHLLSQDEVVMEAPPVKTEHMTYIHPE